MLPHEAAAAAIIAAQFAEAVTYTGAGLAGAEIGAIRTEGDVPMFGEGGAPLKRLIFEIRQADLPDDPAPGDVIAAGGRSWTAIAAVRRDDIAAWQIHVANEEVIAAEITIERRGSGTDEYGGAIDEWGWVATLWAEIRFGDPEERMQAGQRAGYLTARFRLDATEEALSATAADSLVWDQVRWNIQGATQKGGDKVEIVATRRIT